MKKRPWLFAFYGGDMWLVERDSIALYNSNHITAFMSIKQRKKYILSIPSQCGVHCLAPSCSAQTEKLQCKIMSFFNASSFTLKCQAVPVLLSSPFPN